MTTKISGKPPLNGAKLRVGVVGVGYLGKFHAEKYARMPDVELVGSQINGAIRPMKSPANLIPRHFTTIKI